MSKVTGKELIKMIMQDEIKNRQKLRYNDEIYVYNTERKDFMTKAGRGNYSLIYKTGMTLNIFLKVNLN